MWGLVFPGQGSQHPGMGEFLYKEFEIARRRFEEASDTLSVDFKKLCFTGSEAELALTENTQPCLLLVSTATYEVLNSISDLKVQCAAGHSIGEYAALVTAQSVSFKDALRAVRLRGQTMQSAVPVGEGGMLAVMGLTPDEVKKLCEWTTNASKMGPLDPANFNAPGQIVISGRAKVIEWLQSNFDALKVFGENKRVKFIPLKVSAPFHCQLMKPAEDRMREHLGDVAFQDAKWPIVQNFTAQAVIAKNDLRENVIRQISAPVRWIECVESMRQDGVERLIEAGSGKVLAGLVKKIDSERLTTFNINSLEDLKNLEQELLH